MAYAIHEKIHIGYFIIYNENLLTYTILYAYICKQVQGNLIMILQLIGIIVIKTVIKSKEARVVTYIYTDILVGI